MSGAAALGSKQVLAGRYELESLIDRGGMGEVWRARHLALKTTVAIKLLHGASATDEAARQRFLVEAQVTANLKSRHAVQVFDFGLTDDGHPYLVMELVEGEPLDRRIGREKKVDAITTVQILQRAARALDRAHSIGIVHRDFKPENVMLCTDEDGGLDVKVVDFGVAKILGELEAESGPPSRGASVVGTPYYMSPEQIDDPSGVGPPADIWALGVVAYECLTGRRPFDDETVPGLLRRVLSAEPVAKASEISRLPMLFDDWFSTATAKDPSMRFPDAITAVTALAVVFDVPTIAPSASRRESLKVAPSPPRQDARSVDPLSETIDIARSSGVRRSDLAGAAFDELAADRERTASSSNESPPRSKRTLVIGVAAAVVAVVVAAVWLGTSSHPSSAESEGKSGSVATVSAAPAPVVEDRVAPSSAATAAPSVVDPHVDSPPAESPAPTVHAHGRGRALTPPSPAAPVATSSASTPPPPAPSVKPSSAPASPFQLPPLGL